MRLKRRVKGRVPFVRRLVRILGRLADPFPLDTRPLVDAVAPSVVYLDSAAKKYKSKKLKKRASANRDDKANLAPGRWKSQRKIMRDNQYEADMQQAW